MNVYEYAMQMELDGKTFYEDHAKKMKQPQLQKILLQLADDEQKHYTIFKAMRDGRKAEYKDDEKTTILASVKNVFQQLKAADQEFEFPDNAKDCWVEAREVEKKTEVFYREKAAELSDKMQREIFNRIADEEHKHWVTMENVIQFIDRPSHWLEDAEWSHLEEY